MSEKVPSGCPSPARREKADSSSSRESRSSLHLDFDSIPELSNCEGRIRRSSWDESDDDLSPDHERSSEPSRLYSSDCKMYKASVAAEINELKKQFFESLQKMTDANSRPLGCSANKVEINSDDRRQCPARVRRRTKSSSSLSPVLEAKSQNSSEKLIGTDAVFEEVSSKILEFDPKFYLNNFFNDLRLKRISLFDPSVTEDKREEDELNHDDGCIPECNDLADSELDEKNAYFCKTSRKLSQIIEVEENRKDLEKSSEEKLENSHFSKSLRTSEENISPLQTSRSRNEKTSENFKSFRTEDFGEFPKIQKPIHGSLSERSSKFFSDKRNDNFGFLSAKSAKARLTSPQTFEDKNIKSAPKFVCFNRQLETDKNLSQQSSSKADEKENFDSLEYLKIDLTKNSLSENPTPRTTDRSELSRSIRTRSGKSINSNIVSPKCILNTDRDSARSLRIEDVNALDSVEKTMQIEIEFEPKTVSFEDFSPRKSRRSPDRSENSFEPKSDRNFRIPLESSSVESVKSTSCSSKEPETVNSFKSQRSKSTGRSQRTKEKLRKNSASPDLKQSKESYSHLGSGRSHRKSFTSSRMGSPTHENQNMEISNYKKQSEIESKTPSVKSGRSSKSENAKTPKTAKERFSGPSSDREAASNNEILELDLPLDISESQTSSYRSTKTAELQDVTKNSGRSETSTFKHSSKRLSERSLRSESKNTESAKSTPKITPRTNDSTSSRSKGGLENHDEVENAWEELKKINDVVSNHTSAGSGSRKSSWRERNNSDRQSSARRGTPRSEVDGFIAPGSDRTRNFDSVKEQHSSGKSSRRSMDSFILESTRNSSPPKSIRTKHSPDSRIFEERETSDVNSDFIVGNEIISKKITTFPDDEEVKESHSSRGLKSESESERYSDKRLSIINEVSLEDLEISNDSNENEENTREQSRRSSRRNQKRFSAQSISRSSNSTPKTGRSPKKAFKDESTYKQNTLETNNEKWSELIEAFRGSPSSFILENTFSDYSRKYENAWDSVKENTFTWSESKENQETLYSRGAAENKYELPERNFSFENEMEEKEEDSKNSNLDYEEHILEKNIKKDIHPFQNFQNLYYFNVNEGKAFGIGECGDGTSWNVDKSDTPDKPKGHGDGIQLQNTPEILTALGKREKEVKTQRQLWTELRGDFRNAKHTLSKLFTELEDHTYFPRGIPVGFLASKSDNCIVRKSGEESDCQLLTTYHLKNKSKSQFETYEFRKSTEKNTGEGYFSKESLEQEKDVENLEFECERTARLSRSMIDLDARLEKESFEDIELNTNFNSSGSQLFERASATSKEEKNTTNLNIFLARNRKGEKTTVRPNNWLNFKALEMEKSHKKDKKRKKKRKDTNSPKEIYKVYLSTGKSRSSVPQLKLRNSNCFQNFYKRIVSVFCLTSHSSAATSK